MKYRIYRNLNNRTWTVQHRIKGKGWRKLEGVGALYAPHVEFKVYDAGRERVRHEGRKNVHAFALTDQYWPIEGDAAGLIWDACTYGVKYSPWNDNGFTTVDGGGRNLKSAAACIFTPWGVIGVDAYSVAADLVTSTLG